MTKSYTLGFIINPIAGMGGSVGLKGTDGEETLVKALKMGAEPIAPRKGELFLLEMKRLKDQIKLYTGAGLMGQDEALNCGYEPIVIGERKERTSADDTKEAASEMLKKGIDLLVFCGGDGTARDLCDAIDMNVPVLGVPSGVKMYSGVFSVNPSSAAKVAIKFLIEGLPIREMEVLDADEEAIRQNQLKIKLYGYMLTPYEPKLIQGVKTVSPTFDDEVANQKGIAKYIVEEMRDNVLYIIGPGTTTREILNLLGENKTLMGVDLVFNRKLVARDVNEKQILDAIKGKEAKIIVSPIGGQGFIFGRGNLQISSRVIKAVGVENVIVIATKGKLRELSSLRVDTGDPDVDSSFRGFIRVVSDYREETIFKVE